MKVMLALLLVVALVHGHSVLLDPTPFNTNPSTQPLCGVSAITNAMTSTAQADWIAGNEVSMTWHLVAGDGGGNVYAAFDPLGGTDFSVPANFTLLTQGAGIYYTINFVVPDISCDKSPTKLCSLRVYTSSNWNSCTMVSITAKGCTNCAPPPAPTLNCVAITAGSLSFCPAVTSAMVKGTVAPTDINTELVTAYNTNLANPNVFSVPNATAAACKTLYQQLLCALDLPACNVTTQTAITASQACRGLCRKAMSACGVQQAHISLYDCDSYPLCPGESDNVGGGSSSGSSKGMSAGGKAALSIFIIGFVGLVAVAGFLYHKQGHLLGYTFDKESKRIVKMQANPHNYKAYEDHEASGY